jgi:hypothetical protein
MIGARELCACGAVFLFLGCGGRVADDFTAFDANFGEPHHPSIPTGAWPGPPWDGGRMFVRASDFTDFFKQIAVNADFIDDARGIRCSPVYPIASCGYDPRVRRSASLDVHYSDDVGRFIGPDGRSYVWTYVAGANEWFVGDEAMSPKTYNLILAYNYELAR